jgi:ATP-binding cassette subfamily E protein 1
MNDFKTKGKDKIEIEDKSRIAIVNPDRCKPKKCDQECRKICPVNKSGKLCIEVDKLTSVTCTIAENLCIGCNLCVKKCPYNAITIINIPKNLEKECTHRYGKNTFKLHRLPYPQPGDVLGLVGANGIGKSTALRILAGQEKPNLGDYVNPPDWNAILKYFKGSELFNYFKKYLDDEMQVSVKIQHVDSIPKTIEGTVIDLITKRDKNERKNAFIEYLDLQNILEKEIGVLSGGELQRFAISYCCLHNVDCYMFDEPTSYLDIKQRLKAADAIRSLKDPNKYILVVEHDLSILDYLSDSVCLLYGVPAMYGVITLPFGVREGINVFLEGFIPTENMRFREWNLKFKVNK